MVVEREGGVSLALRRVNDVWDRAGTVSRGLVRWEGTIGERDRESQLGRNSVAVCVYDDEGVGICAAAPYWNGKEYA